MALRFYTTLTRQVEPFIPADGRTVRMYTSGPTVYNYVHIGNLRAVTFQDILHPGWRTECVVMAIKYLGETLDIHAGGTDLAFLTRFDSVFDIPRPATTQGGLTDNEIEDLIAGRPQAKKARNFASANEIRSRAS